MAKRWTEEEDNILLRYHKEKTAYELAEMLGCDHRRIRQRAYLLKIKVKRVHEHVGDKKAHLRWTEEEKEILANYLKDGESWAFIYKKLPHRSEGALRAKAREMSLTIKPEKTNESRKILKYELDVLKTYGDVLSFMELKKFFMPHRTVTDIWRISRYVKETEEDEG